MNWKITLSPQCVDLPAVMCLSVNGAAFTINDAVLDLSLLVDNDTLAAGALDHSLLQRAEIRRRGEVIEIDGLLFPISLNQTDPAACFPEPIIVTQDGPIPLPPQVSSTSEPVEEIKENLREN